MNREAIIDYTLRAGVAFALLYPALNAFVDPNAWIGFFPVFVKGYVSDLTLLHIFGAIEILLAVWILSGWKIIWPATIATGMLVGIVLFNMPNFQVLFRDISIAAMSFSLVMLHLKNDDGLRASGKTEPQF